MSSNLQEWSDTIRRLGEEADRKQKEREDEIESRMPEEIEKLITNTDEELLERLVQFSSGCTYPREAMLKAKYAEAIRSEILKRMK